MIDKIKLFRQLFYLPIIPILPALTALPAFSFLPPVPPVSPVALVPPVPFLPAFPYTNLKRTISEGSAKDQRTTTNFSLFFLFVKILRFLQQKASKTDNLSIKDLLVASLLRFLQNTEYHKTMLNC